MRPMLARTYGPKFSRFPCFVQPKLNGVRALFQLGTPDGRVPTLFQSRDEKVWQMPVLAHLTCQLEQLATVIGPTILDGELYVHGWKLQRINGAVAVNRKAPCADTLSVQYRIFDVLTERKFSERWFDLYTPLQNANLSHIRAVPTSFCENHEVMLQHFERYVALGYEGIMLRPDGVYEPGKRSAGLWKYKQWEDGEFLCVATTEGEGKASIGIGALICRVQKPKDYENEIQWQFMNHFNVGTGFDDSERIALATNPPIGKLIKVRYPYLSEDGIPQCPSFLAVL